IPDLRDGLKPVHRRILYAMHETGNTHDKSYRKSARPVGDVMGKYHPHGDTAVYDSIVRLAQPFSMRYCLIDGQGNFGSIDGDSAAAMRYTEVRMKKITHALLADLEKDTVDFQPNYDGNESAPCVLPTKIPNLLINGTTGIAVGMATSIPPHNLSEVINGCIALIDNPNISFQEMIQHIPGPDFPTAGIILGRSGIISAYKTGKGRVIIRAKTHFEEVANSSKQKIIVDELPYQVNKARLIEKIATLVKHKKIEGISELRDESDKDGIRVVIEIKRNENPEIILNNLFKQTQLQQVFSINIVALCDNQPKILGLIEVLQEFIRHRKEVVTRRCKFELNKAKNRCHILEGLGVALSNIDEMISIIKSSKNPQLAKQSLQDKIWPAGIVAKFINRAEDIRPINLEEHLGLQQDGYKLSAIQAQAILDLKLHRLTALEQDKIIDEYQAILKQIFELLDILKNPEKLMSIIRQELIEIKEEFGDVRKTEITDSEIDISIEDLIDDEEIVATPKRRVRKKSKLKTTYYI
ncbi:MAG: DNA topoisomerase 4 subunit A, partial [Legionellales bacterium]|nr:DNA topoisomerase 4 subunit A [Legionellales bacterium]